MEAPPSPGVAEAPDTLHHVMGTEEAFTTDDVLFLIIFLGCVWCSGKLATACKLPSLVGELVVGALLGPPLADVVPFPHALALVGQLGLILLVIESGMEVELEMLQAVGARSALVAFVGSVFGPLLIALGLSVAVGLSVREGLAVGASLSPTSMGCAVIGAPSSGIHLSFLPGMYRSAGGVGVPPSTSRSCASQQEANTAPRTLATHLPPQSSRAPES